MQTKPRARDSQLAEAVLMAAWHGCRSCHGTLRGCWVESPTGTNSHIPAWAGGNSVIGDARSCSAQVLYGDAACLDSHNSRRHANVIAGPRCYNPAQAARGSGRYLSLIHISEPTRLGMISYAVFC